jgi:hypothetical protein
MSKKCFANCDLEYTIWPNFTSDGSDFCFIFGWYEVQILAHRLAVLSGFFIHGFPSFLQANARIVPYIKQQSLPYSFQFIVHWSPVIWHYIIWPVENVNWIKII